MKVNVQQIENVIGNAIRIASTRAALASLLIWGIAGAIWWQALA